MALIEVVGVDFKAECPQEPSAAQPQDDLLQPVGFVAAVYRVRDRPVILSVLYKKPLRTLRPVIAGQSRT
jgi:hypothetical protein